MTIDELVEIKTKQNRLTAKPFWVADACMSVLSVTLQLFHCHQPVGNDIDYRQLTPMITEPLTQ